MSGPRKMLSCPFCGGEPRIQSERSGEDSTDTWVECTACFVTTDRIDAPYAEPDMAAALWNMRDGSYDVAHAALAKAKGEG